MAYKNMCDNRADCKDESDECLCEGAIKISCFQGDYEVTKCISLHLHWDYCSELQHLQDLGCRNLPDLGNCGDQISSNTEMNFIAECFWEYRQDIVRISQLNIVAFEIYNTTEIFCYTNCTMGEGKKWEHFCNRVTLGYMSSGYPMFKFM